MAPTWNRSPRVWLSADLTPAEAVPAPLSVGPGSGEQTRVGEKKEHAASAECEAVVKRCSHLVC